MNNKLLVGVMGVSMKILSSVFVVSMCCGAVQGSTAKVGDVIPVEFLCVTMGFDGKFRTEAEVRKPKFLTLDSGECGFFVTCNGMSIPVKCIDGVWQPLDALKPGTWSQFEVFRVHQNMVREFIKGLNGEILPQCLSPIPEDDGESDGGE